MSYITKCNKISNIILISHEYNNKHNPYTYMYSYILYNVHILFIL